MITLNVVWFPSCPFKFTPTYLKKYFVKKVAWFRWHPKNLSPCISITYLYFSCNLICIVLSKVKFPLIQSHFMPKWKVWKKHRGVRNFRNTLYMFLIFFKQRCFFKVGSLLLHFYQKVHKINTEIQKWEIYNTTLRVEKILSIFWNWHLWCFIPFLPLLFTGGRWWDTWGFLWDLKKYV